LTKANIKNKIKLDLIYFLKNKKLSCHGRLMDGHQPSKLFCAGSNPARGINTLKMMGKKPLKSRLQIAT
jgi:hypothetical protein